MIGDTVDVAGIARRNWRLYGTFAVGIAAAVGVTWYVAGQNKPVTAVPVAEQQQPYTPTTRLDFGKPTRTYEPKPEPDAPKQEPKREAPPRNEPRREMVNNAVRDGPPPDMAFFGGDVDKEALQYFERRGKPNASSGKSGGQKALPLSPGLDDGFQTLIGEDDRQGLVTQKSVWAAGVGKRGDFIVRSPYEESLGPGLVQAGKAVIRAQLSKAINSDIPGEFFAQTTEPVCDSQTGNVLLIPAGTVVQGSYNPQLSYGQTRLQVSGAVLRFNNGDYQPIEGMSAYGPDGEPGLPADVDRHPWQMAGAVAGAGVLSIIGQAGQLLAGDSGDEPSVVVMGTAGASRQAGSIGSEIISRELRRPNTLRYGHDEDSLEIEIVVNKDFVLPARGICQ